MNDWPQIVAMDAGFKPAELSICHKKNGPPERAVSSRN